MNEHRQIAQGGYILVSALLAAGVLFISGLAVASRVTTEVKLSRRAVEHEQAWQVAMAGLEDCLGYLRWDAHGRAAMSAPAPGALVCSLSHNTGDASYEAKIWAANEQQIKVVSAGKAGRSTRTVGGLAFYTLSNGKLGLHAWGGGNMNFSGGGSLKGDVFSAQDITVSGSFTVCGNLFAHGTANRGQNVSDGASCNVGFYSNYPFIEFPDFGVDLLKARADLVINGDHTPQCPTDNLAGRGPDCDGPVVGEKVVWVKGKLALSPFKIGGAGRTYSDLTYSGRVIYVVDGPVDVSVNQIDLAVETLLQVVAVGVDQEIRISPNGSDKVVRGVYVAPAGIVRTPGTVNLYGMVFAKDWTNNGTLNWRVEQGVGMCTGYGCLDTRMHVTKLWEQ